MRILIALTIIVATFCASTFSYAGEIRKVTDFIVEKVQTLENNSGQIYIDKEGWARFSVKSKKDLDKATKYFSKLDQDKKTVIFMNDDQVIIGATSVKYGNFGTPPSSTSPKTYIWKQGRATKELDVSTLDSNTVEFSLNMGEGIIGGCGGMVETSKAVLKNNVATFKDDNGCEIKMKFNKSSVDVTESSCSNYHGGGCDFEGKYTKKK